jgi:hypothetical protein
MSCRAVFDDLPTRQMVVVDWPNPPAQLVTVGTTRSAVGPCRPCPPRARSIGNWRSLTVNNGRQHAALTRAIGVASGRDDGTGRAFQARDRWGHPDTEESPHLRSCQRLRGLPRLKWPGDEAPDLPGGFTLEGVGGKSVRPAGECWGTPGAWARGQQGATPATHGPLDPGRLPARSCHLDPARRHAVYGMQGVKALFGLAVPGRPIRSLVAEDRSAAGVRGQTEPEPDAHAVAKRTTDSPRSSSARAVCDPIEPRPPVTGIIRSSVACSFWKELVSV